MDEGEDEEDLNPEDEEWRTQAGNKPVNPSPPPPPANPNPLNEETMDLASESILCVWVWVIFFVYFIVVELGFSFERGGIGGGS